jgi:FeS assembly SUF system regulator
VIRMTKQTDYGFVLLVELARRTERTANAPELAAATRLPLPMVAKILKLLARGGLVQSLRGVHGGYRLSRDPRQIDAADIVQALEGPVALTVCIEGSPGECVHEHYCSVRGHWEKVNRAIEQALRQVKLADLLGSSPAEGLVQLGRSSEGSSWGWPETRTKGASAGLPNAVPPLRVSE